MDVQPSRATFLLLSKQACRLNVTLQQAREAVHYMQRMQQAAVCTSIVSMAHSHPFVDSLSYGLYACKLSLLGHLLMCAVKTLAGLYPATHYALPNPSTPELCHAGQGFRHGAHHRHFSWSPTSSRSCYGEWLRCLQPRLHAVGIIAPWLLLSVLVVCPCSHMISADAVCSKVFCGFMLDTGCTCLIWLSVVRHCLLSA